MMSVIRRPFTNPTNRFLFIAVLAIVVGAPFAIPVPWVALIRWLPASAAENLEFLPGPVDNQRWFIIFSAAIAAMLALLTPRLPRVPVRSRCVIMAGFGWFAITISRGLLHPQAGMAQQELYLQSAFFLLFASAVAVSSTRNDLTKTVTILAVSALPLAGIALLQNAGHDPLPYSTTVADTGEAIAGKHLIASTFGHPNYMGSYLAPLIVLAAGLAFSNAPWGYRLLGACSAIINLFALVAGGTRGAVLATVAGLAAYVLLRPESTTVRIRSGQIVIFGILLFTASLTLIFPDLRPSYDLESRLFASKEIASRAFYWIVGLEMFSTAPVFGIGPGQFDLNFWQTITTMPSIRSGGQWHFILDSVIRGVRPGQMHNDHLQVLVETGLTGAAAWAVLWAAMGFKAIAARSTESTAAQSWLTPAFFGAFTAVGVDALFGFPFHLPCSGALFWVLLGLWGGTKEAHS